MTCARPTTAAVLCGGKGTRLRPFTYSLPKPLMPVGGDGTHPPRPVLDILIERLADHGFGRIVLCVGHQAELIKSYCGDGSKWHVELIYSEESEPLGTAGPLRACARAGLLKEPFIFANGDTLTNLNFRELICAHLASEKLITAAVTKRRQKIDYGIVSHEGGIPIITAWREKPNLVLPVAMGIYAISPQALNSLPPGKSNMPEMVKAHQTAIFWHEGQWLDIGRPDDYSKACGGYGLYEAAEIDCGS